jgi:hypothetical protein
MTFEVGERIVCFGLLNLDFDTWPGSCYCILLLLFAYVYFGLRHLSIVKASSK